MAKSGSRVHSFDSAVVLVYLLLVCRQLPFTVGSRVALRCCTYYSFLLCVCVCVCAVGPHINDSETVDESSVVIGSSTELHCHANGVPQPTVRWIRDGQQITFVDHPNLRVDNAGQTLTIPSMQLVDIGVYTCLASNAAGNASKQFLVNVLGLSALLTLTQHIQTVSCQRPLSVHCSTTSIN